MTRVETLRERTLCVVVALATRAATFDRLRHLTRAWCWCRTSRRRGDLVGGYGNAAQYPAYRCSDATHTVAASAAPVDELVTAVVLAKLADVDLATPKLEFAGAGRLAEVEEAIARLMASFTARELPAEVVSRPSLSSKASATSCASRGDESRQPRQAQTSRAWTGKREIRWRKPNGGPSSKDVSCASKYFSSVIYEWSNG
ncbi:hypothetical protein ACFXQA_06455 [Microbacterium sp. P07]|uniref:hypothetical protein n=1 Tax=Microbacterium sp. P07 TaxID=3366952 RepID=UPI0037470FDA